MGNRVTVNTSVSYYIKFQANNLEFEWNFLVCPNLTSSIIFEIDLIMGQQLMLNFQSGEIFHQRRILLNIRSLLAQVLTKISNTGTTVEIATVENKSIKRVIAAFADVRRRTDMAIYEIHLVDLSSIT